MFSNLNKWKNRKEIYRRHHNFYPIFILIIFLLFLIRILFICIQPSEQSSNQSDTVNSFSLETESLLLKHENDSIHYIYIDIGCFNGETIEHFLYFTPNSKMYDIITFEPDPFNYKLCKQRLTQKKYENFHINILQKAVWIRNQKILYEINRGRQSRINQNLAISNNQNLQEIDAIDFSSWLARLFKPNKTKIHIKMSLPGVELTVLGKMILDDTLDLVDRYEVEWTDRSKPSTRAVRIYLQLMFDNRGFDCLYYTRLQDARKIFKLNGSSINITKYYNWKLIEESDTYAHYVQRPNENEMLRRFKRNRTIF